MPQGGVLSYLSKKRTPPSTTHGSNEFPFIDSKAQGSDCRLCLFDIQGKNLRMVSVMQKDMERVGKTQSGKGWGDTVVQEQKGNTFPGTENPTKNLIYELRMPRKDALYVA